MTKKRLASAGKLTSTHSLQTISPSPAHSPSHTLPGGRDQEAPDLGRQADLGPGGRGRAVAADRRHHPDPDRPAGERPREMETKPAWRNRPNRSLPLHLIPRFHSTFLSSLPSHTLIYSNSHLTHTHTHTHQVGDVFLGAACIAYYGAFTGAYRIGLVTEWIGKCKERSIPVSPDCTLRGTLASPVEVRGGRRPEEGMLLSETHTLPPLLCPSLTPPSQMLLSPSRSINIHKPIYTIAVIHNLLCFLVLSSRPSLPSAFAPSSRSASGTSGGCPPTTFPSTTASSSPAASAGR